MGLVAGEVVGVTLMEYAQKPAFSTWTTSFYNTGPLGLFFVGATALAVNLAIVLAFTAVSRPKSSATMGP